MPGTRGEDSVYLGHRQAPARRGDRVACAGVRLLPGAELVQFGLEGGAVDGRGPAGVG
jgi:hypothetical protein